MDVYGHVDAILGLPAISADSVSRLLGVELNTVQDNSFCRILESKPTGTLKQVCVNIPKAGGEYIVSVFYDLESAPNKSAFDLKRYGKVTKREMNPRVPPEGSTTLSYDCRGASVSFEFTSRTHRLRSVAIRRR